MQINEGCPTSGRFLQEVGILILCWLFHQVGFHIAMLENMGLLLNFEKIIENSQPFNQSFGDKP
jgi:hypothetical protein